MEKVIKLFRWNWAHIDDTQKQYPPIAWHLNKAEQNQFAKYQIQKEKVELCAESWSGMIDEDAKESAHHGWHNEIVESTIMIRALWASARWTAGSFVRYPLYKSVSFNNTKYDINLKCIQNVAPLT